MRLCLLFLLSIEVAWAKKLNYIEAHLLRLSSQQSPTHWILPFQPVESNSTMETNFLISMEKETYPLYEDMKTQDQEKIEDRLQDSFGKPYDLSAKLNFGFRYKNFSQYFSTNAGALLLVTDPVFPELKGFIFHDYLTSSAYLFRPIENLVVKPQLSLGARRVLDRQYTVGDLVENSLDVKFNKVPYQGVVELSFYSSYHLLQWGEIFFELNSVPLMDSHDKYWDSFLGYQTPDFGKEKMKIHFYAGYSPFYGGDYDVSRTYKIGVNTAFGKMLSLDLFTMDDFYPAAILAFKLKHFAVEFFSFERSYDDFGHQRSRDYGLNLRGLW